MKTPIKTIIIVITIFVLLSCNKKNSKSKEKYKEGLQIYGNYIGYIYKGNYIWAIPASLAWNEIIQKNSKKALQLKTNDKKALKMLEIFNKSIFTENDLDKDSYKILTKISKKELKINLNFLKNIEYVKKFKETSLKFNDEYFYST